MAQANEIVRNDVLRRIKREQDIIQGARAMRRSTQNLSVRHQCDTTIRDAERNIEYLKERLNQLDAQSSTSGVSNDRAAGSAGHNAVATSRPKPSNVSRLDLLRFNGPLMGARIQLMLQQLEFKLTLEQQYKNGIRKMAGLYQEGGDRRVQDEATAKLAECNAKIALLTRSLKHYSDMHLDIDEESYEDLTVNQPKARRPLSGLLTLAIAAIEDVDHTTTSWSLERETIIFINVENQTVARSHTSRDGIFNDVFSLAVEKANEMELVVYDCVDDVRTPVALMWMRLSDIADALRRKRLQSELDSGWASAETVQQAQERGGAFPTSPRKSAGNLNIPEGSGFSQGSGNARKGDLNMEGWFILEPVGRIRLRIGFERTTDGIRHAYQGDPERLGRHNAIRKHDEVTEVHGHQFAHHQLYNIMRCAVCSDFMTYPYQCQECNFSCHRKCLSKVVTMCLAGGRVESEEPLNHRIPHRFEPTTNMRANWCCHCGSILPLGKKNVRKCTECGVMCHTTCAQFIPNFCGMSLEMASQIVSEIRSTRIRQATRAAAAALQPAQSHEKLPCAVQETAPVATAPTVAPPPVPHGKVKTEPIRRKEVPQAIEISKKVATSEMRTATVPGLAESPTSDKGRKMDTAEPTIVSDFSPPEVQAQEPSTPIHLQNLRLDVSSSEIKRKDEEVHLEHERHIIPSVPSLPTVRPETHDKVSDARSASPSSARDAAASSLQPPISISAAPAKLIPETDMRASPPKVNSSTIAAAAAAAALGLDQQTRPPAKTSALKKPALASAQKHSSMQPTVEEAAAALLGTPSRRRKRKVGLDDFSFLAVLGKGNFGKVMLAESKRTKKLYAVKVLKKNFIIENREVESTRSEKSVFLIANRERHPFLINLFACFQTENRIYFVMDYVSGGDLMYHIQKELFPSRRAQFYAAEVLLALKYFHDNNVIYRDLKLDNILLTPEGHIKIADYGLCKENMGFGKTTGTFCGTPDFIAPEILLDQKYGRSVDWWAYGVLMYQMLLGKSPFRGKDEDEVYDAILADEPLYPIHMPRDSVSIVQQLLTRDPTRRLGCGPRDALEIMEHPYFRNIDFDALIEKRVTAPYKPQLTSPTDVHYFDKEFTSEPPSLTPMNSKLSPSMQEQFKGFSYMTTEVI